SPPPPAPTAPGPLNKYARVWNAQTASEEFVFDFQQEERNPIVAWSPEGTRLLAFSEEMVHVCSVSRKQESLRFRADSAKTACWSPDGRWLATASANNMPGVYSATIKVWNATTGKQECVLRQGAQSINSLAWSPDGTRLAAAGNDTVKLWDMRWTQPHTIHS